MLDASFERHDCAVSTEYIKEIPLLEEECVTHLLIAEFNIILRQFISHHRKLESNFTQTLLTRRVYSRRRLDLPCVTDLDTNVVQLFSAIFQLLVVCFTI